MDQFKVVYEQPMNVGECPLWHPAERALYWEPSSPGYLQWALKLAIPSEMPITRGM